MDVIVIGAGYAGLAAAFNLSKKSINFTVLEATSRPGGRTLETTVADQMRLELGGQYINPAQIRVTNLLQELGLKTYPVWNSGDRFLALDSQIARYQTTPAQCLRTQLNQPKEVELEIEQTLGTLAKMYAEIQPATPWKAPKSKEWDSLTFQSWLNENLVTKLGKEFFRLMTNQGFSTEPEQISLLQMLWFLRTSHGIPGWALGGAQSNRVLGGTQRVAEVLADRFEERMLFNEKVIEIEQTANEVRVHTDVDIYRAKAVIVCVPPQLITTIQYSPALPPDLFRAFAAFQVGNSMKVQAVYRKPFWREQGWSGNGISFNGPQTFTYDNSGPSGTPGVLLGFLTAGRATYWNQQPKEERIQAVLKTWAQVFGDEALSPIDYIEQDWLLDPSIRGGHGCHFPPGVWNELGPALGQERMPAFGRILWAASDLAKDWNGYLEGAIFAGEQASEEAEKLLKKDSYASKT